MGKGPCFGCTRRTITCHGVCEEYKAFQKEREAINADLRERKSLHISHESMRRHWRNLRTQNRRHVKK